MKKTIAVIIAALFSLTIMGGITTQNVGATGSHKIDICHWNNGSGYIKINVALAAVPGHLFHFGHTQRDLIPAPVWGCPTPPTTTSTTTEKPTTTTTEATTSTTTIVTSSTTEPTTTTEKPTTTTTTEKPTSSTTEPTVTVTTPKPSATTTTGAPSTDTTTNAHGISDNVKPAPSVERQITILIPAPVKVTG